MWSLEQERECFPMQLPSKFKSNSKTIAKTSSSNGSPEGTSLIGSSKITHTSRDTKAMWPISISQYCQTPWLTKQLKNANWKYLSIRFKRK